MKRMIQILIVGKDASFNEDLAGRLIEMGYYIKAVINKTSEAITYLENNDADILLIDIHLKGGREGIELGLLINELFQIPFIFLSSTDDNCIIKHARRAHPSSFLLKPVGNQQIRIAIEMTLENRKAIKEGELNVKMPHELQKEEMERGDKILFLKRGTQFKRVHLDDILWLEAESNYTSIVTKYEKFIYSSVLKSFAEKLPGRQFLRVHRSFVVNIKSITGFEENRLLIKDKRIPISKNYRKEIFQYFEVI